MLKAALMFKDRAVLQREKKIPVWGTADADTPVTVSIQGQEITGKADQEGKWCVWLEPLKVSFHEELVIASKKETVICHDVMVGDVWFAGGQSNMEFHMRYDADIEEEKKVCENPNIRFFDYPEVTFPEQIGMADYETNYAWWRPCDEENLERYSAVAYYCIKELQKKYQIPMGILACNLGGTPAMAWIPEEVAKENGDAHRITDYHKSLAALDVVEYDEKYLNNPANFRTDQLADPISDLMMFGCSQEELDKMLAEMFGKMGIDPDDMDQDAFNEPMGPKHMWRPAGVYESMLLPCVPYGIKGFLYYQGCSDSDTVEDAEAYDKVFPALIRHWRSLWKEDLPFLFVQLAPLEKWMAAEGKYFPITRRAQQWTAENVENTAMAVTTDVGMQFDIHPKKKQPVGYRLALLAEHYVYGEEDVLCEAPTLKKADLSEDRLILTFDNSGEGLHLVSELPYGDKVDPEKLEGLEVYRNDEKIDLSDAEVKVSGDRVEITDNALKECGITEVRIAETGWFLVNLYNSADIPVRPAAVTV